MVQVNSLAVERTYKALRERYRFLVLSAVLLEVENMLSGHYPVVEVERAICDKYRHEAGLWPEWQSVLEKLLRVHSPSSRFVCGTFDEGHGRFFALLAPPFGLAVGVRIELLLSGVRVCRTDTMEFTVTDWPDKQTQTLATIDEAADRLWEIWQTSQK